MYSIAGCDFKYEPFYIGVSKNSYRKYQHVQEAKKYISCGVCPKRNKRKVYKIASILKAGQTPIIQVVAEQLDKVSAYNLEYELVNSLGRVYDNTGPLLNFLPGGQIINAAKISNSLKDKGLNLYKRKEVLQLDMDGHFIKKWDSVAEAKMNTGISHIAACCRGDRKSAGNYIWKYADRVITRRDKYRIRETNKVNNRRAVEQYTLDGIKVNEYSSITEAADKTSIARRAICNMLMGESKSAGGFIWQYKHKN